MSKSNYKAIPLRDGVTPHIVQLAQLLSDQISLESIADEAWEPTIRLAINQGVAPLVDYIRQKQDFNTSEIPDWKHLDMFVRGIRVRNLMLESLVTRITHALNNANVDHYWLKGSLLAHWIYENPNLRVRRDLDLYVPPQQRQKAFKVLSSFDVQIITPGLPFPATSQLWLELTNHYNFQTNTAQPMDIELHYQLFGGWGIHLSKEQYLWFERDPIKIQTPRNALIGFRPEAQLIYMCIHDIVHHFDEFRLQRTIDVDRLLRQTSINWHDVLAYADEIDCKYVILYAVYESHRLMNTPLPPIVRRELEAMTFYENFQKNLNQLIDNGRWSRLLMRLSTRNKFLYLWYLFIPTEYYLSERYAPVQSPVDRLRLNLEHWRNAIRKRI